MAEPMKAWRCECGEQISPSVGPNDFWCNALGRLAKAEEVEVIPVADLLSLEERLQTVERKLKALNEAISFQLPRETAELLGNTAIEYLADALPGLEER